MPRRTALIALLAVLASGAFAQRRGFDLASPSFDFVGPRFNFLALGGMPLPAGADILLAWPAGELGGLPLDLTLGLGAGFESKDLLRDPATGDPLAAADKSEYHAADGQWDAGLRLGLIPGGDGNRLELFAAWRGRYEAYLNHLPETVFRDMRGLFGNALFAGLGWNAVERDARRVKSGGAAEASVEWAPAGLSSVAVDYLRLNARAEGFLPLFSRGSGGLNLLSAYLAGFCSADWASGESIPIFVLQSFGGRDPRRGLGGSVRGYPSRSWDAEAKAVANLELRVLGPAMFGIPWLMPVAYAFADAGAYSGLHGAATTSYANAEGFLASAGAGLALDLFDFAYLGLRGGVLLPGGDSLFEVYLPGGGVGFLSVEFLLHF